MRRERGTERESDRERERDLSAADGPLLGGRAQLDRPRQVLQLHLLPVLHLGVPRSHETAPLPRDVIGPYAQAYCMVLGGGVFL